MAKHELFYFNSTLNREVEFTYETVKMDISTGLMTFNTTLPFSGTLIIKINSLYGVSPARINFDLSIVEKPDYVFNAKPVLEQPPKGVNLVVSKN